MQPEVMTCACFYHRTATREKGGKILSMTLGTDFCWKEAEESPRIRSQQREAGHEIEM